MKRTEHILPIECAPSQLITAQSFLVDRFTAACEEIALPATTVQGGVLTWTRGDVRFSACPSGRRVLKHLTRARPVSVAADEVLIDFRLHDPQNWAHFLNNHLPLFFHMAKEQGLSYDRFRLILPKDIPPYILEAAALFGIPVLNTDSEVRGEGITFNIAPWTAGRAIRRDWVMDSQAESYLQAAIAREGPADLPERVFISRRDGRCLENEDAVATFLENRGYRKLYAEDLTPLNQFRLFREARHVVAIHGAALAPLLYCPPSQHPVRLVELMPCGHMTNVFRVIAQRIGTVWIGVRGKIKPEHVVPAYALDQRFTKFSLQSFEIDLCALEYALDLTQEKMRA